MLSFTLMHSTFPCRICLCCVIPIQRQQSRLKPLQRFTQGCYAGMQSLFVKQTTFPWRQKVLICSHLPKEHSSSSQSVWDSIILCCPYSSTYTVAVQCSPDAGLGLKESKRGLISKTHLVTSWTYTSPALIWWLTTTVEGNNGDVCLFSFLNML